MTDHADDLCTCGHQRAWHVGSAEHPTSCSGDAGPGTCDCRAFEAVRVSRELLKGTRCTAADGERILRKLRDNNPFKPNKKPEPS